MSPANPLPEKDSSQTYETRTAYEIKFTYDRIEFVDLPQSS
mgnify:FL=1